MEIICAAVIILFVLFSVISCKTKLYNIEFNPEKNSHNTAVFICAVASLCISCAIYCLLAQENLAYPYIYKLESLNAYEQQFDAFLKHQLNLDISPSFELMNMLNPYDYTARTEQEVSYLWDRAYFGGNYYSYFGIAPILLIYYPFYFIFGKVPEANTVCFILSAASTVAIALLVIKAHQIFVKKPNLFILLMSIFTCETGSLVYTVQASADMYYIAVASGILFLALFLLFSFKAYGTENVKKRCINFFLSAISLVFIVLSRPSMAAFFIIAIPIYVSTVISDKYKPIQKFYQVLSFSIPAVIGAIGVMWYNYARFGSVFEFGAKYQLTVHDVSEYAITVALFPPALRYYIFQLPVFTEKSPYFTLPYIPLKNYPNYVYITSTIGIMSFPANISYAISPLLISRKSDKTKTAIFILAVICVIAVSFADMCLAGVNIRYLADIALVAIVFSTCVLSRLMYSVKDESDLIKQVLFITISLLLVISTVIGVFLIFINERNNILNIISAN